MGKGARPQLLHSQPSGAGGLGGCWVLGCYFSTREPAFPSHSHNPVQPPSSPSNRPPSFPRQPATSPKPKPAQPASFRLAHVPCPHHNVRSRPRRWLSSRGGQGSRHKLRRRINTLARSVPTFVRFTIVITITVFVSVALVSTAQIANDQSSLVPHHLASHISQTRTCTRLCTLLPPASYSPGSCHSHFRSPRLALHYYARSSTIQDKTIDGFDDVGPAGPELLCEAHSLDVSTGRHRKRSLREVAPSRQDRSGPWI